MDTNTDTLLINALLAELRYVLTTCDVQDCQKNSGALRDDAAKRLGFTDYAEFEADA